MLHKHAVANYLRRQLDSYDWLKSEAGASLAAALNELEPRPELPPLWAHQQACLLLALELKRFMLFTPMGSGKTLISLSLIKYRKQRGEAPKAVVMVPYLTAVDTWIEEVKKHAPDLGCVPLLGTTAENLARLTGPGDLFVICYQSAVAMVTEVVQSRKKHGKVQWKMEAGKVRQYFAGFDTLILDEVHRCKGHDSITFRMCRAISSQAEYVLGLTGTPFGRDPGDLWPQFYLVDFGETLGPTLGLYREAFFTTKPKHFGGFEYTFKAKLTPVLHRVIKHRSLYYSADELYDMPKAVPIIRYLPPPLNAEGYCEAAINAIEAAVKGTGDYRLIESNYLQLRQLSSGFMTLKGQDDERIQVKFDDNPKLDALTEMVGGMAQGEKLVCFHTFIYSNHMISERLTSLGVKHARIWGGQRNPLGELKKFREDPDCTVLVINTKSGSSSLNLQFASLLCFFEQPDSPIDRAQAEGRVWRPGQTKRVRVFDFLVRKTWDRRIYDANKAGESLLKQLMSGRMPK